MEADDLPESARGAGGYGSTGGFTQVEPGTGRDPGRRRQQREVRPQVSPRGAFDDSDALAEDAEAATGPFDVSEVDEETRDCVDLGSLLVTPMTEMELQLQVDEESGEVMAVVLVAEDGALELRAFAASRGGGAWDELRPRIAAEMARLGGTVTEQEGTFGTELLCLVPMVDESGQAVTQASRIVAHEGRAWLLRATLMGLPALDAELAVPWEETIRQIVVRRGREAMAPGSAAAAHPAPRGEARRLNVGNDPSGDPPLTTLRACPSTRAVCAPRSVAGPTRTARRPASCARTPRRPDWSPSARRPTARRWSSEGTLKTVTLRPRGGVPALEAELYDGSGSISVVWLGRRRIGGILPGRAIRVEGRIGVQDGARMMYNPRYDLRPM